jgi:photosystem II stability/assembly factor-like uncharacterized protein
VHHSSDGGQTFGLALAAGLDTLSLGLAPERMAVDPQLGTGVVLGDHAGIWYTSNGGTSWTAAQGVLGLSVRSLFTSPLDPARLWLASWGSGVWNRPSPTKQWQHLSAPTDYAFTVVPDAYTNNRVFVGSWGPILQSNDDGQIFVNDGVSANPFAFTADPSNSNVIYAATQVSGVYKSTDSGMTWNQSNGALTPWATPAGNFIDVRSIVVDPSSPQTLYIGTLGRGVYRSTDGAITWTNILAPSEAIGCLLLIGGSPSALYACVHGGGIQRTSNGGATWTDVSAGLPSEDATGLALDVATGDMYSTAGPGVYVKHGAQPWAGVDVACTPGHGAGTPAIVVNGKQRLLVVSADGAVYAHSL